VADAGWFRFFKGAQIGEPHGWTAPHNPAIQRQPEVVQRPPTLADLRDANDLRIVPP